MKILSLRGRYATPIGMSANQLDFDLDPISVINMGAPLSRFRMSLGFQYGSFSIQKRKSVDYELSQYPLCRPIAVRDSV